MIKNININMISNSQIPSQTQIFNREASITRLIA